METKMAAFERATVGLFLWWSANAALGNDSRWVNAVSRYGVAETVERIEEAARRRGLSVERVDYSAQARAAGFKLRPTQSLSIGRADAPLKLVVWQAPDGATVVTAREERALALALPAVDAADPAVRRPAGGSTRSHVFARSH
jgi:hypothetical protein